MMSYTIGNKFQSRLQTSSKGKVNLGYACISQNHHQSCLKSFYGSWELVSKTDRTKLLKAQCSDVAQDTSSATKPVGVLSALSARGLLKDTTIDIDALEKYLQSNKVKVYCGFDPTASSLHLGNLLGLIVLTWFSMYGHEPVVLVGGATGRVGDPSGKSAERPVLDSGIIDQNVQSIADQTRQILVQNGVTDNVEAYNNLDWFGDMNFLWWLANVGKVAKVNEMVKKDVVRTRLDAEQSISYTEFSYMLLQAFDFAHLNKEFKVRMQIGGSDQLTNIQLGLDIIKSKQKVSNTHSNDEEQPEGDQSNKQSSDIDQDKCFGLTFPLLTDSQGRKYGKSENGALWLDKEMMSPYQIYQHLFNTPDVDVFKFLRMMTFVDESTIKELEGQYNDGSIKPNAAQALLASEVTKFIHGPQGQQEAVSITQALKPGSTMELSQAVFEALVGLGQHVSLPKEEVIGKMYTAVLAAAKVVPSRSQAKKKVKGKAASINNSLVDDLDRVITEDDVLHGKYILVQPSKKVKKIIVLE